MSTAPSVNRAGLLARVLLCAAAVLLAALWTDSPTLRALDDRIQDVYTAHGPQRPAPPGVVIVDISEASLAALGPWPWSRSLLAEVSESLRARGARVQVWDLMLPEAAVGDERLARTLSRPDVVLGQVLVTDPQVAQPPQEGRLQASGSDFGGLCSRTAPVTGHLGIAPSLNPHAVGHVGSSPDLDGRLRRLPAVICHEGRAYPQLALVASEVASAQDTWRLESGFWPWQPAQTLVRGNWRFPLDEGGWMRVPYARSHLSWPAVSVEQLLDPARQLPELKGSIVLVGSTALGLADIVNTPFHPVAPGVGIHAEIVAAALPSPVSGGSMPWDSGWLIQPKWGGLWSALVTLLLGSLLAVRLWPQSPLRGAVMVTAGVLALPFLLSPLAREAGWLLPTVPAMLALLIQAVCTWLFNVAWLRRQSLLLARHLQGFMPQALAREIAGRNPTGDSLGHAEHGTVMAIRIEGLERWQDSVPPLRALGLIHGLHATAQSLVAAAGGRLEQAQGNTLIAAWPASQTDGVAQALVAARACLRQLQPLLERNESEPHPLSMNIAIESGPYLHGVVGHADSRRAILLGPAVADVQGMLELSGELGSPVLLGPHAAMSVQAAMSTQAGTKREDETQPVQRLGTFLLPQQVAPKDLFRLQSAHRSQ